MLQKKVFFIFSLTFLINILNAQNVIINGYAPYFKSEYIAIKCYVDFITPIDSVLCTERIDSNGYFKLILNVKQSNLVYFSIGNVKSEFYVEPDSTYSIIIKNPDTDVTDDKINYNLRQVYVSTNLEDSLKSCLHNNIQKFNDFYNYFLSANYKNLRYRNYSLADTFRILIKEQFPESNNLYFNNYVKYRVAAMEQYIQVKSEKTLVKEYIKSQPLLYDNVEYMDFFSNLYTKYLIANKKEDTIISLINNNCTYKELAKIIDDTVIIPNERVKELVILKNLYECYYKRCFEQSVIINLLEYIKDSAQFEEHKLIAKNIIKKINTLKEETIAPDFEINDNTKELVKLSDLKGKFVFITFLKKSYIP